MNEKLAAGTFAQVTPGVGRTWHRVDHGQAFCRVSLVGAEYDTTGVMPAFKVCDACQVENARRLMDIYRDFRESSHI